MKLENIAPLQRIKVIHSEHSKFDCLPLRFGVIPQCDRGEIDAYENVVGTQNQKPIEIQKGHKHYVGKLIHNSDVLVTKATFVLAKKQNRYLEQRIISVMLTEVGLASRGVSDLIRYYRKSGDISPEWIMKYLHPVYKKGEIANEAALVTKLVEFGVNRKTQSLEEMLKEVQAERDQAIIDRDEEEKRRIAAEENIMKATKRDPQYKNESIEISPICTLTGVKVEQRTNYTGRLINCTRLSFEEDVPTRTMDQWADPSGQKTKKAKALIGKKVQTTVWKPESFSPLEWFRDIYEVN